MIKKVISFTMIFLIMLLVYQFFVNKVKSSHFIKYSIEKENSFSVEEKYIKNSKEDYYLFKISDKNNNVFLFDVDNNFNKQKEVIEDVYEIEQNGYYCVAPIYLNNKYYTYPLCVKDNILYSYSSVKDIVDFSEYMKKIKDDNREKYFKESSKVEEEGIILNKDYFDDNEALLIYNYKLVSIHFSTFNRTLSFSNVGNYKNTYGTMVGKYYMIPKLSNLAYFDVYYKYDVEMGVNEEISLPKSISKQSYLNGVYNDKLYIFDKSNLVQYEIDPKNNSVKEIGNEKEEGFAFRNGKEEKISVYDLNKENIIFSRDLSVYSKISYDNIYVDNKYAIYEKDGNYYKVYNEYVDNPIFLFKDENINYAEFRYGNLYYVKDNSIYKYNEYGSYIMAINNEFKFNYDNIFDVYKF